MEPIIREYTSTDRNACIEAFKSNVPKFFTIQEIEEFENFLTKTESEDIRTRFYVLVDDQKVIGCGGFGDKDNKGILSLAWGLIHQKFHKRGFGEKLLIFRLEQIKQLHPELPVIVDTTQYSCGFFEKHGFRTTKITKDYYTIGMHRYDMVLFKQGQTDQVLENIDSIHK